MNQEQRLYIKKNLDILLRRKKTILFCLLLGMAAGVAVYLQMPKVYESSATLRYQRQSIGPSPLSNREEQLETRDLVNTVSTQVTSRTSLEEIITRFDLYAKMREQAPIEEVVDVMRKEFIKKEILEGDIFQISFQGDDQQKVVDVTNALAHKFIEENSEIRQSKASQASAYIEDELRTAKEALDQKEQVMKDYKMRYYNEMPDQLANNTSRLNSLQERYQAIQTSRLELERTRLLVQDQITARITMILAQATTGAQQGDNLNSVEQISLRLQSLQSRYTDRHPEVKHLKKLLASLGASPQQGAATQAGGQDAHIVELKQQLQDIEYNISRLDDERLTLSKQIDEHERWLAATPVREAEWAALTRDYQQLNQHYQGLVTQRLQADSAITLENQLKGSQFKIIDTARFPDKPIEPDFKVILLLASAFGFGIGCAIAFGIELLKTSFKDPVDLENYLGVPVICALPSMLTAAEIRGQRTANWAVTISLVMVGAVIISGILYFWNQGLIII